ncbi:MAG: metallophosphoesterase [Verrucomicrobiota bacterium]
MGIFIANHPDSGSVTTEVKFAKMGFQLGLRRPLEVREEIIQEHARPCRLAYVSDIHLRRGRSRHLAGQVLDALHRARPDVILLGGDLVDQASELDELREMLGRMLGIAPVFAIPGNHDVAVGEELVRLAVQGAGALWIAGRTLDFQHEDRILSISGPGAEPSPGADFRILCAHNPSIWKTAGNGGYDMVLAGHLHGCQGVLFEAGGRLYPGAIFYPHNHIRQSWNGSRLVVGMGCSDLIPIRWGCPREIVVCIL